MFPEYVLIKYNFSYWHIDFVHFLSVGCRADSDCSSQEACVNRECVNPCQYTQCGKNAICKTNYNHRAGCYCLDTYRGNPFISCERPECVTDNDCPYNLQCVSEKCTNPCNCAVNAECRITNHRASCRCPNGYTGDATQYCNPSEIIVICNSILASLLIFFQFQYQYKIHQHVRQILIVQVNWHVSQANVKIPVLKLLHAVSMLYALLLIHSHWEQWFVLVKLVM